MKTKITSLALLISSFMFSQQIDTQLRNDAGTSGVGTKSGFFQTANPVNYPSGATSWWHLLDVKHTNTDNNFAMQFSGSFFDQNLYFRKTNNSATTAWSKILMEDPAGNIYIKNNTNSAYAGNKIQFGSYGEDVNGPYIKSSLSFAGGTSSKMALKLGSYWEGEKNELTLINGNVGIGIDNPTRKLTVGGDIYAGGASAISFQDDARFTVTQANVSTLNVSSVSMPQYGITAPNASNGAELWISGYSGIRMFTGGEASPKFNITSSGNASLQGKFEAKEIKVTLTPTADFVFEENYGLPKLKDVEKFIKENKHLPEVASAKTMEKEGVNVGEFQIKLLQKIEELTLYVIDQQKKIETLENKLSDKK